MNLRPNFSGVPFHTVMVSKDRKLYAWGQNNSGQLGLGHEHDINTPNLVSLPSPSPVVDLGLGGYHTLVALENGEVYAWGRNDDGQLGLGDEEDRCTPQLVPLPPVQKVGCGNRYSAALAKNGDFYLWGSTDKQLGVYREPPEDHRIPNRADFPFFQNSVTHFSCGGKHVLVLTKNGDLYGWGENVYGQLGSKGESFFYDPAKINLNFIPKLLATSFSGSLAISETGELYGWGCNSEGQLGYSGKDPNSPKHLFSNVALAAQGLGHTLVLTTSGKLLAFGKTERGQCGTSERNPMRIPTEIKLPTDEKISGIGCGSAHCYVVTIRGNVWTWGYGSYGQLGHGVILSEAHVPKKIKKFKFYFPDNFWSTFQWIFLGITDPDSGFFGMPKEVLFHLVGITFGK